MRLADSTYRTLLLLVALWCAGIVAAPILTMYDLPFADALPSWYSPVCHQLAFKSFTFGGEPWGVCIRCSAIYFSFFAALLAYPFLQRRFLRRIPSTHWLILAVAPLGIDAVASLTSFYESTTLSRLVTGSLFGSMMPWFLLPPLTEGIAQLRHHFSKKGRSTLCSRSPVNGARG